MGSAENKSPSRPWSRKPPIPFWLWAAVAAALLFAWYNAYEARSVRNSIRQTRLALDEQVELQKRSAQDLALARREAMILTDPRSVRIAMPAAQKALPALQAAWHGAFGILISGENLPAAGENRAFQLWLIPRAAGAKPIPSLALRPDADGKFHMLVRDPPDSLGHTKALAVTEEPAGGSPQPTTALMWIGAVPGRQKMED